MPRFKVIKHTFAYIKLPDPFRGNSMYTCAFSRLRGLVKFSFDFANTQAYPFGNEFNCLILKLCGNREIAVLKAEVILLRIDIFPGSVIL